NTSSGIERVPEKYPLRSYLESLHKVLGLPDSRLLPAHGHTSETLHRRARKMLDYHDGRLQELWDRVDGPISAHDLVQDMRWTRRNLKFRDLPMLRQVAAVLEVGFHLDELVFRGDLSLTVNYHGTRRYS